MIFTSTTFWSFFVVFCCAYFANYFLLRSLHVQNALILAGSYYVYAWWDWRFLALIVLITLVTYVAGLMIADGRHRKAALWGAVGYGLGVLFLFKYFNFFVAELARALAALGFKTSLHTLSLILPVGISFYTFQGITYVVDVYRGGIEASRNFLHFAAFKSFFPQLVAGPIERGGHLLPQFSSLRAPSAADVLRALQLILIGLALKLVVADNLAPTVDKIFSSDPASLSGGVLALGMVYFAFQIYGDFCGYSTMAVGTALILGFDLVQNFDTPYFAPSIQAFWRRWHISLSTFFRDYVYIPLGGDRRGPSRTVTNLLATFGLSGLWHGANWTFVVWGLYHGGLLVAERAFAKGTRDERWGPAFAVRIFTTFVLVCIGWVFFRSPTLQHALAYLKHMLTRPSLPETHVFVAIYLPLCVLIDVAWRGNTLLLEPTGIFAGTARARRFALVFFTALFWLTVFSFQSNQNAEFIYFQF